jgi:hypothetical protein
MNAAIAVTFTGTMNGVITPVAIIVVPCGNALMSGAASRS